MARSHSIHIVQDTQDNVLAAFTVKHECKTWLSNRLGGFKYLRVCTMKDGGHDPKRKYITANEFMA